MIDYSELKRLAVAIESCTSISEEDEAAWMRRTTGREVVVLLDEIDELKADNERQSDQFKEWQASHHANYVLVAEERDQLKAEVEALRQGMKGDYDLDAWLDWTKEARSLRDKVEHLECMTESHKIDAKIHRDVAGFCAKKLRSAEICHPRAVDTLVGEAREALAAYLPEGWPQAAASKEASNV